MMQLSIIKEEPSASLPDYPLCPESGLSHDYPNKWLLVYAFLDEASRGDFSNIDYYRGKTVMKYSDYLDEVSRKSWDLAEIAVCELSRDGISGLIRLLDQQATEASRILQRLEPGDAVELYDVFSKAYFGIYAREFTDIPRTALRGV